MNCRNIRIALAALSVFTLPATSAEACCGLWKSWFGAPAPTTTFYAPYRAAYAPAGCGQTVNYMPQTCFRTVYVNTPVTTFRPEPACGPCGTPTTVMRPVVSYVMRPQLVPYTTYRPVVAAPVVAAAYYAPAPVAVAAPAAPCCGGGAAPAPLSVPTGATVMAPAPMPGVAALAAPGVPMGVQGAPLGAPGASVPSLAPQPGYPGQQPGYSPQPGYGAPPTANTVPSLAAPPQGSPPAGVESQPNKTFENGTSTETNKPADSNPPADTNPPAEAGKPVPQSRVILPAAPRSENPNDRGALRGLDPEDQDRLTTVPLRQAFAVRPASVITRLPAPTQPQDSEWRAARP